ncbi:MAG: hypothetical protein J7599_19065 [Niabella sp.]|nr:hypothetical protein [Niabella sp.]
MNEEVRVDADQIHILNVRTLQGNIDCDDAIDNNDVVTHAFAFELENAVDIERLVVAFKLKVEIQALNKKQEQLPAKGSYTHEMVFKVDNLAEFTSAEEKLLRADMGSVLVGILYSTIRGIIFTRTQGTPLNTVILPIIPPLRLMGMENMKEEQKGAAENEVKEEKTDKTS